MATWKIDSTHTTASFAVRHMMVSTVRGRLGTVNGTLEFDPENPAPSRVEVEIDASSIDTGVVDRDTHLKSEDFLHVEHHPTIFFRSTKVEVKGKDEGKIHGDLTIRGVTHPVVLETTFLGINTNPWGNTAAGFEAKTKINREDFGLTWNVALEAGGFLVGKEITITIDLEAILVTEPQPAQ
jgi:polyisoprenoid-binding protein YceI